MEARYKTLSFLLPCSTRTGLSSRACSRLNILGGTSLKASSALEERVGEILEQNEDEMEFQRVDRRSMFWLIKKKLAKEYEVILSYEDRYNALSHEILETCWKQGLIEYNVSENRIKNVVYTSMEHYLENFQSIEDDVAEKISNYKRKVVPGSEEYDLIFEKLYEEELKRRGMMS